MSKRKIAIGATTLREDAVAVVSLDGELLEEYPLYGLLGGARYRALVHGVGALEEDRFHLNDVQPVFAPGLEHLALLSIRNLSTIAALNLNTWQIEWSQTGPWLNQHDVNRLPDGRVSVFGNELVRETGVLLGDGHSEFYIFDPANGAVSTPFTEVLSAVDMRTPYEGRARLLENGDLFIEETNRDRLLRVSPSAVRWEYVNGLTDTTSGALHWSRYIEAARMAQISIDSRVCAQSSS